MQLAPLQLEIQKLGAEKDKKLGSLLMYDDKVYVSLGREERCTGRDSDGSPDSFDSWINTICLDHYIKGYCFVDRYSGENYDTSIRELHSYCENRKWTDDFEIIGHPITYSRLCYLLSTNIQSNAHLFLRIELQFENNTELYNQSILERPEEIQLLVRDFLLSIQ